MATSTNAQKRCRWGILGTAEIARKNWKAILNAGNAEVVAVASRNLKSAQSFIRECQAEVPFPTVPRALGSYEEMLKASDIDAIYMPVPTGIRKEWILRAAEAGKHVLAEKPAGVNTDDVVEMVDTCRRHNVQYMDGVMFMHSQRLTKLAEVMDSGEIGNVKRICAHFSFRGGDEFLQQNIRVHSDLEPQGCLGDLGWYCIRIILWTLNWKLPRGLTGRILTPAQGKGSPSPVPAEFSAELFFEDNVTANFYCSFLTEHQQWVNIGGTKGYVYVPDFVLPRAGTEAEFFVVKDQFDIRGCDFQMRNGSRRIAVQEDASGTANAQEARMIRHFSEYVLTKQINDSWPEITLRTQQVLDACLEVGRMS